MITQTQRKTRTKKPIIEEKRIHILAKSPYFVVSELVPEAEAVTRLEQLRDSFERQDARHGRSRAKLTVATCVHNPTLF
jgi:hypothetical protein